MAKLQINPEGSEEIIEIFLDPLKHPVAYSNKLEELMDAGMSRVEAQDFIRENSFEMEVYYSSGQGLFLVESEPIAFNTMYNPYDGNEIPNPETSPKK